jgi:hypothetical protein
MLLHEYAHYEFWRNHKMLNKDKDEKNQFSIEQQVENERYAYSQEEKFLKRLGFVLPLLVDINLFRVKSGASNGQTIPVIKPTKIWAKKTVKKRSKDVREIKRRLQKLTVLERYNNETSKQNTETHSFISTILKLDDQRDKFPVVEMEYL